MPTHPGPAVDVPTIQPKGEPVLTSRALAAGLLALMLCARLPAYWVNDDWLGDAVSRTDLAIKWAAQPHWMTSFADGAYQFGPLHLYVVGAALKLGASKQRAGPLTSLLFGTLTVLPLAALTRRLFGREAAVWSGVALAFWALHVQMSTTGASEALSLFLLLCALALFEPDRLGRLAASGLALTLGCAVRYDTWMLAPLLALLVLVHGADRRAAFGRAVAFGLCCLPFPLSWLWGNWRAMGDPLYPIHFVEAFHRDWILQGIQLWGKTNFRVQNLLFWPGVALYTLGPLATGAGLLGMGWAFRARRDVRWLLWVAWVPVAYFTFRSAVLLDFQPLARFTVGQVVLLLPFIKPGADLLLGSQPRATARGLAWAGAVTVLAMSAWLAYDTNDTLLEPAHSLLPLSPLSRNPAEVRQAVALFDAQGAPEDALVLVDAESGGYRDLQVAFFIHHPTERVVRRRWQDWDKYLEGGPPDFIFRFEGGPLETTPGVSLGEGGLQLRGRAYQEVPGAPPPLHLYRAAR